jgi:predicted secreted Zn-dependent protease
MRSPAACVALTVLACAAHSRLAATPGDPVVRFEHYAVSGRTFEELRRELAAKGPRDAAGRRRAARTDWSLGWRYACRPGPAACAAAELEASAAVTITLPRLAGAVPPPVRARWLAFEAALADHEDGHRTITLACRDELAERLASVGVARDCADLRRRLEAAGSEVDAACRARHAAFDERTEHGTKPSAAFR